MNLEDWPDCAIKGCPNKCCLRLRSRYCWPHTPGVDPQEVADSIRASEEREVETVSGVQQQEKS